MSTFPTSAANESRQGRRKNLDNFGEVSDAAFSVLKPGPANPASAWSARRRVALLVAFVLWGMGVAAGSWHSFQYETTAAETTSARDRWPMNALCELSSRRPTLVMFAHPHCPCTRASLNELSLLMTHCQGRVEAHVIFFRPQSSEADWARTDLWNSATEIPGVAVRSDLGGAVQKQFDARASGEVFLYMPAGGLAFHGGITASRGHAGDNDGRGALESLLLNQCSQIATTPVFGCALIPANRDTQKCDAAGDTRANE